MDTTRVYLAGGLFDLRQLTGNAALGEALELRSEGRYTVYLPQDYEPESLDAQAIRDGDFAGLLACDAAIFQFDGTELDAGTVAEFMAAKFADIPSVLLRTDFRKGGDRNQEPWNLMCSFYPRTESLVVDAMQLYVDKGRLAYDVLADLLIDCLERVVALPPLEIDRSLDRREQLRDLIGIKR